MARTFGTAGPCVPGLHYLLPAVERLPEVPELVAANGYFVVHAPPRTGVTTALQALAAELTADGRYAAVVLSMETGSGWGDDVAEATDAILDDARADAEASLPSELRPPEWPEAPAGRRLGAAFGAWAKACPRPLVLFLDEIDALEGRTLITMLSQLRSGYRRRPAHFPASVALCGLRDVRDYKTSSGGASEQRHTSSPFNIKIASLRLGDFTEHEVGELLAQHTAETGQVFAAESIARVFALTAGQPWLVNALAYEIVSRMKVPVSETITLGHVEHARDLIIRARETYLDSLLDKLREPAVRRVLEPVLAGEETRLDPLSDDLLYVRDLGLIADASPVEIANPVYREIIARVLTDDMPKLVSGFPSARSFVLPDGRFDVPGLLARFGSFWRANEEILIAPKPYREATPHLTLMAFLDRALNGSGRVERESGVGRGHTDLDVRWTYRGPEGTCREQHEVIEVKTRRPDDADPVPAALAQLDGYLDRRELDSGYLVVFDQRPQASEKRTELVSMTADSGRTVTVVTIPGRAVT